MAVAFDVAASTAVGTSGAPVTTATLSFTGAAGAALVAYVGIGKGGTDVSTFTITAKYNGVSMSSLVRQAPGSNTSIVEKFGLLACCDGAAHNIDITVSTSVEIVVGAKSYTGAGSFGTAVGSAPGIATNSGTLNVSSAVGDMVDFSAAHGDVTTGIGGTGTQRWINNWQTDTSGGCGVGGSYPGAATVACSATSALSDHWTLVAVPVQASGGAAVTAWPDLTPPPSIDFMGSPTFWMPDPWESPAAGGTLFTVDVGGSITPAGALTKDVSVRKAGSITGTGALSKLVSKPLAGSSTPTGALLKLVGKPLAGSATPSGVLAKVTAKTLTGSSTASGALAKLVAKTFTGSSTATGGLTKLVGKLLSGSITPTGSLTVLKVILRTFTGSITPAGTLLKQVGKQLGGSVTPTGSLLRSTSKGLAGTLTPSGVLLKSTAKGLAGSITSSGTVKRLVAKAVGGSVAPSGTLAKLVGKSLVGSVTPAGSLLKFIGKRFTAAITAVGNLVLSNLGPVAPVPPIKIVWQESTATVVWTERAVGIVWQESAATVTITERTVGIVWTETAATITTTEKS